MVGTFIKQYKGKDLSKVAESKLDKKSIWFVGMKYDGNYIQIHKKNDTIIMFTSSGKPFVYEEIANELLKINYDFIIEAEFNNIADGSTLNDRRLASTGTARANFKKGIPTFATNSVIHIFDVLFFDCLDVRRIYFKNRIKFMDYFTNNDFVKIVDFKPMSFDDAIEKSMEYIRSGSEGAFAYNEMHQIKDNVNSERSNLAIKLKASKSEIMTCIGMIESNTVIGEYGSFILRDKDGHEQAFGGLTKELRQIFGETYIGCKFLVKYESFTRGKYVQGFISGGKYED